MVDLRGGVGLLVAGFYRIFILAQQLSYRSRVDTVVGRDLRVCPSGAEHTLDTHDFCPEQLTLHDTQNPTNPSTTGTRRNLNRRENSSGGGFV